MTPKVMKTWRPCFPIGSILIHHNGFISNDLELCTFTICPKPLKNEHYQALNYNGSSWQDFKQSALPTTAKSGSVWISWLWLHAAANPIKLTRCRCMKLCTAFITVEKIHTIVSPNNKLQQASQTKSTLSSFPNTCMSQKPLSSAGPRPLMRETLSGAARKEQASWNISWGERSRPETDKC